MQIGKRIYYDILTGNIILDTGERQGSVVPTTVEQDISVFVALSERTRESFDYIDLEYGQYAQDFAESNGYRINPETKRIEFSYTESGVTEPIEPIYQTPLSEEVKFLKAKNQALTEQVEFHEELIVELATEVYSV